MSIGRNREKFSSKGLGNLQIKENSPSADTEFSNFGELDETTITKESPHELLKTEKGYVVNALPMEDVYTLTSNLLQVGYDEISYIKDATGKLHCLRYYGVMNEYNRFQYYCIPCGRIDPSVNRKFMRGKQILPLRVFMLKQDEYTYDIPEKYLIETDNEIYIPNLHLWIDARLGLNNDTSKILDISGWERHGDVAPVGDVATIWQAGTPTYFLRLDGSDDYVSFGDILDDDASGDFVIEGWFAVKEADSGTVIFLSKKSDYDDHSAGFVLYRHTDNTVIFKLSDGDSSASIVSAGTILQNTWKHILVSVDRNGNGQVYINGAASGNAVSVASETTAANSVNLLLGREGTSSSPVYSQIDIGNLRIYRFAAGGLPSTIATIAATHYAAERNYYGV